jgi:protein FRG1
MTVHQQLDKTHSNSQLFVGWINAEDLSDLKGPLMLIFRGRERIFTLSSDADSGTVLLPLSDSADTPLSSIEPLSVQNVVTAHPLPNNPNNYSLKTAHGTFLGCDSFGVVSSDKIAVGPQEEWTPLQVEGGGFSFQSVCYQTFLHAQEDSAGQIKSYGGISLIIFTKHNYILGVSIRSAGTVRCDSQTVGVRETWLVKCQAAQKKARLKKHFEIVKREKGAESAGHIELDQLYACRL